MNTKLILSSLICGLCFTVAAQANAKTTQDPQTQKYQQVCKGKNRVMPFHLLIKVLFSTVFVKIMMRANSLSSHLLRQQAQCLKPRAACRKPSLSHVPSVRLCVCMFLQCSQRRLFQMLNRQSLDF